MKGICFLAAAALAVAGCSSEDVPSNNSGDYVKVKLQGECSGSDDIES